ncbi:erythromycin esterase family protein [Alkaliphilus hydrothermalis]|uniref:Erythromycin esterase n=1 Tax=Alkaliphilus hydrothermalis TaxID=1482730 RepID=A0ABS2NUE6_9FIRM|nr:erythromycin esterase family protein [Alkaliphilus hydrothermalis]MBM7616397.1 erythromycin esterase [Alkaliphilus hydrothermalis]
MKKRNIVLGIIIAAIVLYAIILAININSTRPKSSEAPNTLVNHLIQLKTTKAGSGFDDLEPLKEILQNKRVIAMGEATHGTKEFFEMKHRMFEFLVEEMGYRVFAIEAEFGGAQVVNDYILHGEGNLTDSLKALQISFYQTEEVANLIEWMRIYNQNPNNTSKIKFYGFDMQNTEVSKTRISEYLRKVDSAIGNEGSTNINNLTTEDLALLLDQNKQSYINHTSESEYNMIYQHLNIIKQNAAILDKRERLDSFNLRDDYMAENVQWIVDYEKQFGNERIMLWAHNGHIGRELGPLIPMGKNLHEVYTDELYAIGFDFYQGSLRARPRSVFGGVLRNIAEFDVKTHKGSFAYSFHKTGMPIGLLDFKSSAKDEALANWLSEPHYIRYIGATYSPYLHQFMPSAPIDVFDAIIFIDDTSAAIGVEGAESSHMSGHIVLRNHYLKRLAIVLVIVLFSFLLWLWVTERSLIKWVHGLKFLKY